MISYLAEIEFGYRHLLRFHKGLYCPTQPNTLCLEATEKLQVPSC